MKRNALYLMLTLGAWSASAASMHYSAPHTTGNLIPVPPMTFVNPATNNFSGCSSTSNTVAVGYDIYPAGFRMLCADAGRIGFWTTPTPAVVVGEQSSSTSHFLCPSGSALGGVMFVEGLTSPLPLCGELLPDFASGQVHRTILFTTSKAVIEKESKTPPTTPGVVSCGVSGYVQTLQAARTATGAVSGFGAICNSIETTPASPDDAHVDLAVKSALQQSTLGRNANENFRVDVFNLGTLGVPASNVVVELRFDGAAWDIQQFANALCTDIMAHKGVVDMVVVGKRCTMPVSSVPGHGGVVSMNFQLQPMGPDTLRPAGVTTIFSVRASLLNETLQGADANANNDVAAFPVILQ